MMSDLLAVFSPFIAEGVASFFGKAYNPLKYFLSPYPGKEVSQ